MKKRRAIPILLMSTILSLSIAAPAARPTTSTPLAARDRIAPGARPNVIVILADDMGYGDLSSYGSKLVKTENIDSIARDGVKFTNGYSSAPLCSPSRAGLVTGRYQQRFGFEQQVSSGAFPELREVREEDGSLAALQGDAEFSRRGIPISEKNIGELFKAGGYATGVVGKWHLGHGPEFLPQNRGFDFSDVFYGNTSIQYRDLSNPDMISLKIDTHDEAPMVAWTREGLNQVRRNGEIEQINDYLLFHFRDQAVNFIEANKNKPFMLYFAMNAPVPPLQVPAEYFERLRSSIPNIATRGYNALLLAQDEAVGAVLAKLRDTGLDKNTIVIFVSDNGTALSRPGSNAPFSGGKYSTFEGGIHMPYMMKWAGHVAAGQTYAQPVSTLDILPTVAMAAGVSTSQSQPLDGVDLMPYLKGTKTGAPHDALYWKLGTESAVRIGNWKLWISNRSGETRLFDLDRDPGEKIDQSKAQPQVAARLRAGYDAWNKSLPPRGWTNISPVFNK